MENKSSNIQVDKKTREETKEAILEMLIIMITKIKIEINNARKDRESTEETLLSLLEDKIEIIRIKKNRI